MHAYHYNVVEDGRGIHADDSYHIRRVYDDQTSILSTRDIGVESYYASNKLENSTTNPGFYHGDDITLRDVTVENMSYTALSNVRIRFFLSVNKVITTSDHQLGGYWYWSNFSAETFNVSDYTTTIPSTVPAGEYYVGAIVTINGYESDDYTYNNRTYFYDKVTILVPECSVSPTSLDFGTVCVDDYSDRTFTITNVGTGQLAGTFSETCSQYSIIGSSGSYLIGPGHTKTFTVRFQPTSIGSKSCTIETGNSLCSDISCTGVGDAPVCQVTPSSLDFGTQEIGSYAEQCFTITNVGGCVLTGDLSESCGHYSIVSGGGSYNLAAGQSRTVCVRFQPVSVGPWTCSIETSTDYCSDIGCNGVGELGCNCGPIWGDVNGDDEINPVDVVHMVNFVYKNDDLRTQPPNCPYEAGDVDCNAEVNPVDVVRYVNYVYKNITPFPCDPCA
jgi:hypothetical protein